MRGVISVVTGGGKTIFAQMCMLEYWARNPRGQVLILVPTVALLDQWFISLQEDLNVPPEDIGTLSADEDVTGTETIIVAVINSARAFTNGFSIDRDVFLIVDECHRAGSPQNARALVGRFKATLGLSATPQREYDEGFELILKPVLGDIIYEYSYMDAAREGVITKFDLINVSIAFLPDEEAEYARLSRLIARLIRQRAGDDYHQDERLIRLLQRRAAVSANATMRIPVATKLVEMHSGERAIVFHEQIGAADTILHLLQARNHRATIYHTRISPTLRRDNLRWFRRGLFDVLVCCRALDEGMNVPDASVAVIASSTASQRQRIQRLGRILRRARGKEIAIVYTLYATQEERNRLAAEADKLREISSITWRRGQVRANV